MHLIEPYYEWRNIYVASEDELSPFYGREYSEFEFTNRIYDHYIHPQWDDFGSNTLFIKIIYCAYSEGFAIIEFIGEWNDLLHNDIMFFKRDILEVLMSNGIDKFILIGENVLNLHCGDDDYYEEWFDEVEDGWIALLNFRDHVLDEFRSANIDSYFVWGGELEEVAWRTYQPNQLCQKIENLIAKRIAY